MFISTKRGARLASVVGLTAVAVVALASPAAAAPDTNQAFGIRASGLIVAGPFAQANFPSGPFTSTLLDVTIPTVLSSKTVTTNASGTSADAAVEDLAVTLGPAVALAATAVSSECSYDPDTAVLSGSASIAAGVITAPPAPPIALAASPAANTVVAAVPGVAAIILNRQTTTPAGTLTVDAVYIQLLSLQEITIATSHCHAEVLVIPVIAPQFAAGAGVLGLLALGFVLYRRRQNAVDAA